MDGCCWWSRREPVRFLQSPRVGQEGGHFLPRPGEDIILISILYPLPRFVSYSCWPLCQLILKSVSFVPQQVKGPGKDSKHPNPNTMDNLRKLLDDHKVFTMPQPSQQPTKIARNLQVNNWTFWWLRTYIIGFRSQASASISMAQIPLQRSSTASRTSTPATSSWDPVKWVA